MDAGKSKGRVARDEWRVRGIRAGVATNQLVLIVKQEQAGGFARLHGEGGEGAMLVVKLNHAAQVDVADDVNVVKDKNLIGNSGGVRQLIVR